MPDYHPFCCQCSFADEFLSEHQSIQCVPYRPLLQPIYEMIISNRIENKKLAATRDILLPKLMNGEIDMSEVDYE